MNLIIKLGFFDHPKVLRLAAQLGLRPVYAGAHLMALWAWAHDYCQDGRIIGATVREIALYCRWTGRPERFVKALVAAGFLDEIPDGFEIHDFIEHQGDLAAIRAKDRERKRLKKQQVQSGGNPSGIHTDSVGIQRPPTPTPTPTPSRRPSPLTPPPTLQDKVPSAPEDRKGVLHRDRSNGRNPDLAGRLSDLTDHQAEDLRRRLIANEPELARFGDGRSARDFLLLVASRITETMLAEVLK